MMPSNIKFSETLYQTRYYLYPLALFWLFCIIMILNMGYQNSFLFLNGFHHTRLDPPMLFLTFLGDNVVLCCIFTLILINKKPEAIFLMIVSLIIASLISAIGKQFLFSDWDRPLKVFEGKHLIHTLGFRLYFQSFPSGHSTSVAAVCMAVAVYYRSEVKLFLLSLLTILICYSRIYTGVHFPGDVLAGSLIGTITAIFCTFLFAEKLSNWFYRLSPIVQKKLKLILTVAALLSLITTCIDKGPFFFK